MKIRCEITSLEVTPGELAVIPLEVINTDTVIESARVTLVGIDNVNIETHPSELPLFPQTSGNIDLTVAVPETFPAGTYPVTLVVSGITPNARSAHHNLDLVIPRKPALQLLAAPSVIRARRKASFPVTIQNTGNVTLDVALRASDVDRRVRTTLLPATATVPAGRESQANIVVKGPRQLVGADRERLVTVVASTVGTETQLAVTLQQRSTFSRGFLTALILLAIIALWVAAFLFGIRFVLGAEPYAKVAPGSFFAGMVSQEGATGAAPEGALAKSGVIPTNVGGTITGTVVSSWDASEVSRLTVDALRQTKTGLVVASSTATQSDGTYILSGLFPGNYYIRVSAEGYDPVWYPDAKNSSSARTVPSTAQEQTSNIDLRVTGHPATLTGNVTVAGATTQVDITVTAQPAWSSSQTPQTQTVHVDSDGQYQFTDLPAPASYQLTFSADGFRSETTTQRVLGGQNRYALDMTLGSGTGSIQGIVTDGTDPIGAVTVTTTVNDETVSVGTPTVGSVGQFTFSNLPTPATYVLTFTKDGYTTRNRVVDLAAGEVLSGLDVTLVGGAGTVTGKVVDPDGNGIGSVQVSVGGTSSTITTSTLTGANAGQFTLSGLTIPGQYTLTFTASGYQNTTIPVQLTSNKPTTNRKVTLQPSLGSVVGRVTIAGSGKAGMTVTITDGTTQRETTSTASGDLGRGTYSFDALSPGTYTVTLLNEDGRKLATTVVDVTAVGSQRADLPAKAVN